MGFSFSEAFEIVLDPADLTGQAAKREANEAADIMERYAQQGITEIKHGRNLGLEALEPFQQAGEDVLPGLLSLIQDPEAQRTFIQDNPFFNALATQAKDELFANQAARGKLGTGETAKALQNSLVLLGSNLLNQSIAQRQNVAGLGQSAASQQAVTALNAGQGAANLLTQIANARAAASFAQHKASTENRAVAANFIGSLFGGGGGGASASGGASFGGGTGGNAGVSAGLSI